MRYLITLICLTLASFSQGPPAVDFSKQHQMKLLHKNQESLIHLITTKQTHNINFLFSDHPNTLRNQGKIITHTSLKTGVMKQFFIEETIHWSFIGGINRVGLLTTTINQYKMDKKHLYILLKHTNTTKMQTEKTGTTHHSLLLLIYTLSDAKLVEQVNLKSKVSNKDDATLKLIKDGVAYKNESWIKK